MPSRSRSCQTASVCAIPFSRRAPVAIPGIRGPWGIMGHVHCVNVPELVMSLAYVCMCMLRLQSLLPLPVPGIWFHHHHRPRTPSSTQDSRGGGRRRCFGRAAARPPHSLGYACLGGSCDTLPLATLQRRPDWYRARAETNRRPWVFLHFAFCAAISVVRWPRSSRPHCDDHGSSRDTLALGYGPPGLPHSRLHCFSPRFH